MSEAQQPNQPQQPQPAGPPPPGPSPLQPPATQAVQPAKKRFALVMILPAVLAAVVALLAGIGIGAWGGGGWGDAGGVGRTTAAPAPAVTVTETVTAPVEGGGAPTVEPSQEPTGATFNPKPNDFKVGIKILKKTCHGELGCDVEFRIVPSYVGSQAFPTEGTTVVTYEVIGGTNPITNTFEVDEKGTVTFDEEESTEIASSSTKLVANVIDVSYNRFR